MADVKLDEVVMNRLGEGRPQEAFEAVFGAHRGDVERFVASRLRDRQLVRDVCQETWLAARQALDRFRGGSVRSWLFAIAFHKIADALREGMGDAELESQLEADALHARPATTPSRKLVRKQDGGRLLRWLEALTPEQREWFELRFVDGLKPAEIAERLRQRGETVTADAMAQRLHRLVVELRRSFQDE